MKNVDDVLRANVAVRDKYASEFAQTFGKSFRQFWNNLTAFDIIAFDDFIMPEANESLQQAIGRKYGAKASALINDIMKSVREGHGGEMPKCSICEKEEQCS